MEHVAWEEGQRVRATKTEVVGVLGKRHGGGRGELFGFGDGAALNTRTWPVLDENTGEVRIFAQDALARLDFEN